MSPLEIISLIGTIETSILLYACVCGSQLKAAVNFFSPFLLLFLISSYLIDTKQTVAYKFMHTWTSKDFSLSLNLDPWHQIKKRRASLHTHRITKFSKLYSNLKGTDLKASFNKPCTFTVSGHMQAICPQLILFLVFLFHFYSPFYFYL